MPIRMNGGLGKWNFRTCRNYERIGHPFNGTWDIYEGNLCQGKEATQNEE
jgi:hypothetical protein